MSAQPILIEMFLALSSVYTHLPLLRSILLIFRIKIENDLSTQKHRKLVDVSSQVIAAALRLFSTRRSFSPGIIFSFVF